MFDGKQIHDIQIQGVEGIDSSNIVKILANGSGDVTEVMPILTSVLLNSSKKGISTRRRKGCQTPWDNHRGRYSYYTHPVSAENL